MRTYWHRSFLSAVHCHRVSSEELVLLVHLTEPRFSEDHILPQFNSIAEDANL